MPVPQKRPVRGVLATGLLAVVALPLLVGAAAGSAAAAVPAATGTPVQAGASLSASPASLNFGGITVGDASTPAQQVVLTDSGTGAVTITSISIGGADDNDFTETDDCATTLAVGATCTIDVTFVPGALGVRQATLTPIAPFGVVPSVALTGTGTEGYYEATAQGAVTAYGDANDLGEVAAGTSLTKPVVAIATTGDDTGYWLVGADGGVFTYGSAGYYGSTGALHLNAPIVGVSVTNDARGYWLVAADGGVFAFGDAGYFGSTGNLKLNKPIVDMAPTSDDGGYWLVASDGGVFAFGDAAFYGSTGSMALNKPIVGMAPTPDGKGYWLVASDGGIFTFGNAAFFGSTGKIRLNEPIVGMAATPDGEGYWLMASDGGIFCFGDAPYDGSSAAVGTSDFVSIAGDAPPTVQAILDQPAARRPPGD